MDINFNFPSIFTDIIDYLGFYSYRILFWIAVIILFVKEKYGFLFFFVFFYYILKIIVKIIKPIIRNPRPLYPIPFYINENLTGFEKFGFPSGHASSSFYVLSYLWYCSGAGNWTWVYPFFLFICICALYQRYVYRRHTFIQLIAGMLIGLAFGKYVAQLIQKTKKWKFSRFIKFILSAK